MTSEWWIQFCQALGIVHQPSTAFHPQTNGLAERTNQTLETVLRTAAIRCRIWYDVLQYVEIANNSAALPKSHFSPYYLNYGFNPTTEADIYAHHAHNPVEDVNEFIQRIRQDWQTTHEAMLLQQERMKQRTDQGRRKS